MASIKATDGLLVEFPKETLKWVEFIQISKDLNPEEESCKFEIGGGTTQADIEFAKKFCVELAQVETELKKFTDIKDLVMALEKSNATYKHDIIAKWDKKNTSLADARAEVLTMPLRHQMSILGSKQGSSCCDEIHKLYVKLSDELEADGTSFAKMYIPLVDHNAPLPSGREYEDAIPSYVQLKKYHSVAMLLYIGPLFESIAEVVGAFILSKYGDGKHDDELRALTRL